MAPKKIRYQSRSVEVHVDRPRDEVWPSVVEMIRRGEPSAELSVEPPWRFAYEMATGDTALSFWQSTVLIRDDGSSCHVAWSLVFDPEPDAEALQESERILADMRDALERLAAQPA